MQAPAGVQVQTSGHRDPADVQLHPRPPVDEASPAAAKRQRTAQAQDVSSAPTSPGSPAPAAPPDVCLRNAAQCQPGQVDNVDSTLVCPAAQPEAQLGKAAQDRPPAGTPVEYQHLALALTLNAPGAQPPEAAQAPLGTMALKDEELLLDLTLDSEDEEPAQIPDRQAELRPPARAATALQSGMSGAQTGRESTAGMGRGPQQEQQPQQAQRSQGAQRHLEPVAWEPLQARPAAEKAAEAGSHAPATKPDSEQEPRSFQGGPGHLHHGPGAMQPQGEQQEAQLQH